MNLREIKNKKFLGKGNFSKCYLLDDGNVLKIFNKPKSLYEMDNFKYFIKYSNDSFVFPFEFIYDSRKFYGYIMREAPGKTLLQAFPKSNLLDLSKHSHKLERDIDYVSKGGIVLYDLHDENILYDGCKYTIIDPDENGISRNVVLTREANNKGHRILLCNLFLDNIKKLEHTQLIRENIERYKKTIIRPSDMIIQIKEDMENYYKEKVETVDDLKNIIRR